MNKPFDATRRQLKEVESDLANVVKYAYLVMYVEGVLRAEKEDCTFMDAIQNELAERELLATAKGILEFERFRRGTQTNAVHAPERAS